MDLMNVEEGKGYLNLADSQRVEISQLSPQGGQIRVGADEDAELINNSAARIIYRQLRNSFLEVIDSRETILEEIDDTFSEAEAKYFAEPRRAAN
jgi:hypothetical protein